MDFQWLRSLAPFSSSFYIKLTVAVLLLRIIYIHLSTLIFTYKACAFVLAKKNTSVQIENSWTDWELYLWMTVYHAESIFAGKMSECFIFFVYSFMKMYPG